MKSSQYSFDTYHNRRNTNSLKWDNYVYAIPSDVRVPEDILPFWVADMDFKAPDELIEALTHTAQRGFFGYETVPYDCAKLAARWLDDVHHWSINPDSIFFSAGVIYSVLCAVLALTEEQDEILIFSPIYRHLFNVIADTNRVAKIYQPRMEGGQFEIDFDELATHISNKTKMFILCNPHNPSGRVWTKTELTTLAKICLERDIIICSNDIHADIIYSDYTYTPIASLSTDIANNTITNLSPSKTFNLGGQKIAYTAIHNPLLYEKVSHMHHKMWGGQPFTNFGVTAFRTVYTHGHTWYKELMEYLQANRDYTMDFLSTHTPQITPILPQATYLLWMDCRSIYGNDESAFMTFLIEKARVLLNLGSFFGKGGEGYMRFNFACPRSTLTQGLERIANALNA